MASISSLGIGSGVLTSDLVDQLVEAERAPTEERLTLRAESAQAKISAYGQLSSAITELRLPLRQLSSADSMTAFSATSSNEAVSVSVDSSQASRGTYSVEVISLATAQALASRDVFADRDTTSIGQGTLTLTVGDKVTEITIDSSNDTLQGLANAINEADAGVSAGVIDTGSGYQLVLSAEETGTANAVSISVSGDSDGSDTDHQGLSRFAFNSNMEANAGLQETIAATDAVMSINGVTVTRSVNSFDDVVSGLSFTLSGTGSSIIRVEQDYGSVADRVQAFVDQYNALQTTIDSLSGYDSGTGTGGLLTGDSTVRAVRNQLRQVLTGIVSGLEDAAVRSLADVGITTNYETGWLDFDRETFIQKLEQYPDDVTALFAEQGRPTDSQVEFVRSGVDTEPGTYEINVTRAATRGTLTGSAPLSGLTIDNSNDLLALEVNGEIPVNLHLTHRTYASAEDLLAEIQAQLDSNTALGASGVSVQASLDDSGRLVFTSSEYGSDSSVILVTAGDAAAFGLDNAEAVSGVDVAGTIGGLAAEGDGQVLYVSSGSGGPSGIQVRILGEETGYRGAINFVQGIGETAVDLITSMVGADGLFTAKTDSLNSELERIAESQAALEERMEAYRARLVAQFTAADSLISQLNTTGDYVSQQLAALAPGSND